MGKLLIGSLMLFMSSDRAPAADPNGELVAAVVSLAKEMARNASDMHAERNARLIPNSDKVVYVSFGYPITGKDYIKTLSESYEKRQSLSFVWEKWEVTPIGRDAAVFTGWATVTEVSRSGEKKSERVIFTEVFAKSADGWKRIIAQKSLLDEN